MSTFRKAMSQAAANVDLDDAEIAQRIGISEGYMSKFMRHVGEAWAKRLIAFMRVTGSTAPLQWIAEQMDCDVVRRGTERKQR